MTYFSLCCSTPCPMCLVVFGGRNVGSRDHTSGLPNRILYLDVGRGFCRDWPPLYGEQILYSIIRRCFGRGCSNDRLARRDEDRGVTDAGDKGRHPDTGSVGV